MRAWKFRVTLVGVVATAAALLSPGVASACVFSPTSAHCYGSAIWSTAGTYAGGLSNVKASRLTVPSGASNFATSELWIGTNNWTGGSSGQSWVEEGIERNEAGQLYWFWAEQSPQTPFARHVTSLAVSLDTVYEAKSTYNNGNKYAVYRNGSFVSNTTTTHALYTHYFSSGTESTSNSNQITGTATGFQKKGASGTWSFNWGGATIRQDAPVIASWITQYASMSFSEN